MPPLRGTLILPGDKSISHRALMLGAIATGRSRFTGLSTCADVRSTASCLRALGVSLEEKQDVTVVEGRGLYGLQGYNGELDCGNSGTTMRLLTGILSGQPFSSRLTGDDSLRRRPMRRVFDPLGRMGASFEGTMNGTAPFRIDGKRPLRPIEYSLAVPSAQLKSAVLLAGLFAEGKTVVIEKEKCRDHTERMLGVTPVAGEGTTRLTVDGLRERAPLEMEIPGDVSAAAFLIAAASLVPGSEVIMKNVGLNPTRTAVFDVFRKMGADISIGAEPLTGPEPIGTVTVRTSAFHGSLDLSGDMIPLLIDELPILTVAGTLGGMEVVIRGAGELRAKESDRIGLLVRNLRAVGCDVEEYADGFASRAKNGLFGARIETAFDHRIAMSFGVASLLIPGITIDHPECVDVSFPGFWNVLSKLSGTVQR